MPETISKGLEVPTTGSLPGTWGALAVNPNFEAIDGMFGGYVTVALSGSNVTLTSPAGYVATPGAGPTQSQNALISLIGTLSGPVTLTFPLPGFYLVENLCIVGAYYVRLGAATPGAYVCAPPGETVQVFSDGVNMRYVGLGRIGTYLDLGTATTPAWITNCTVPPYLFCNGSTFDANTYPVLASMLGGNTLPDHRGRTRYALDAGTNRVTSAVSGVDGATLLAAGGDQSLQQHTHSNTVSEAGNHFHYEFNTGNALGGLAENTYPTRNANWSTTAAYNMSGNATVPTIGRSSTAGLHTHTVTNSNTGSGSSQNMPPAIIGGITLIRAA